MNQSKNDSSRNQPSDTSMGWSNPSRKLAWKQIPKCANEQKRSRYCNATLPWQSSWRKYYPFWTDGSHSNIDLRQKKEKRFSLASSYRIFSASKAIPSYSVCLSFHETPFTSFFKPPFIALANKSNHRWVISSTVYPENTPWIVQTN